MSIKIRYGGYISALKDGVTFSEPCFVECDSPLKVISELKKRCLDRYPVKKGYYNHDTSTFDLVVVFGLVKED